MLSLLRLINKFTIKIDIKKIFEIKLYCIFFLSEDLKNFYINYLKFKKLSKSQIFQDILAITVNKNKNNNYFVEFGAGDGIKFSNTFLLEKLGWKGLLVEPAKSLQKKLKKSRKSKIFNYAIDREDYKKISFYENSDPYLSSKKASHGLNTKYTVTTLKLNTLLRKNKSPKNISYISIDTEGNEYEILKKFDFRLYNVNFFTIEHNFNEQKRIKIFKLMKKNNYIRIFKYLSHMDDWYLKVS